jgi:hypothetical protein
MTKLNWRLQELPTGGEIADLVEQKIITQKEAREILFSTPKDDQDDVKSLKSEINFLRELVEKLSGRVNYYPVWQTINTKPYSGYGWMQIYTNTLGQAQSGAVTAIGSGNITTGLAATSNIINLPRY